MKSACIAVLACSIAAPCLAQEPVGCDKFKWPLDKERAMLMGDTPTVASGKTLPPPPVSVVVTLVPFAEAKLPMAPERAPKSTDTFAGFVEVPALPKAGTYKVSLSAPAWVDAVQSGALVKSAAFSGVTGCEGIRKSVKFDLAAQPFTVQLSAVAANSIRIAITGD
jgi:hypothetical protein